jgi:aminopeptidase N
VLLALPAAALLAAGSAVAGEHGASCREGKLERTAEWAAKSYDADSGRNLRNYAPDRFVDFLHMKLDMRFEDLEDQRFEATETLRFAPIGAPVSSLTLDAVGLDVSAVRLGDRPVEFFVDDETIAVRFDRPLERGAEHELVFEYACDHPTAGMYFTPAATDHPDYTAEVHTQGQSITNRHWFIAHDSPNERMTTELIVNVPSEFQVSSNGRLVSSFMNADRAVFHWLQDKPHVSYLVTLVIGQFDVVEIPHARVPMKVWVPRGMGDRVMRTYGRTGEMIDVFEARFGVPYPWDRYDQLVVKNFGAGGMENTSATSMYPSAIFDERAMLDRDLEGLISHELAHQWTGDLLTCKEWAHIWLNEGFASYGEAIWFEYARGWDGYLDEVRGGFRVARRDRTTGAVGMTSPVYEHPGETFRRAPNPYSKGASILHMLRMMLGEEVFWPGIHLYMNRHALGTVETHDLRYALEEVSGRGLEWFFVQWCERPGTPELKVALEYAGATRELVVTVEQTQQIDERTPAFRFTLPVHVRTASGDHVHPIEVTERSTTFRTTLDGAPVILAVDPELHVLATLEVEKPQRLWSRQAVDGPTIVARRRAIDALGRLATPDHRALLAEIVRDESVPHGLRSRAVEALAEHGLDETGPILLETFRAGVAEARVRLALVRTLAKLDREQVGALLADVARNDESYATQAAAIDGLAKLEAKEHVDLIVELVRTESQDDAVRRSALSALAKLDDPRGLDLAIEYAAYGYMDRSRPAAISAIGDLAEHDTDRAVEALLGFLDDPGRRPAWAAGRALANLGDERAVEPIGAIAISDPSERRREAAERWLETLKKKMKEKEKEKEKDSG